MPHTRIGILGAGQLGMMLAQSARAMGKECKFLAHGDETSCVDLGEIVRGDWSDPKVITHFTRDTDVITYEFENTPLALAASLEASTTLRPNSVALQVSQDRINEKQLFTKLRIPTPKFLAIDSVDDLSKVSSVVGLPCVLKTRRMGYDGKGQRVVRDLEGLKLAFDALGRTNLIAEEFINFEQELSIIGARSAAGEARFFPMSKNFHRDGILRTSIVFHNQFESALQKAAEQLLLSILNELDYVGVMALELFQLGDSLLANEIAPRVHNTGHWSMDGASISQFEMHIRAICGETMPEVSLLHPTAMINLIGDIRTYEAGALPHEPRVYLYNKLPRPDRKLGHLNIIANTGEQLLAWLNQQQTR